MTNASYGVTRSRKKGLYSTALPDDLALATTWDGSAAYEYGALLGGNCVPRATTCLSAEA